MTSRYVVSVAGKPALPIRCGVFHTRLILGCPQWQATQGSSLFGGWQANLAKHVAVSATLIFATPQAAYANPLRSANFYIMQDRYAQCSRPKSIAHKGHYAKVGWQYPPTRVAERGSVRSLRGCLCRKAARVPQLKLWPGRAPAAKPPAQDVGFLPTKVPKVLQDSGSPLLPQ